MKIKRVEVYGFGKWVDTTFETDRSLQIFLGANEAGKTTLMSFIHSILFGFPAKQSSDLRYEPKSSSQYGGRLTLNGTSRGEVLVERVKGKANGDVTVTLASGETGSDELLDEILGGINKTAYQDLFSFDLTGIQKIQQVNRKKLNRYFLSIGALGNEQLLKTADKLQQDAAKLYKPTGRVPIINKKIRQVESKRKQLKQAKEKNIRYTEIYTEKTELEKQIESLKTKQTHEEESLVQLNQLAVNWEHFNEIKQIQQQLQQEYVENLPEDGLFQLNHLNKELEQLKLSITKEKERLIHYQNQNPASLSLQVYLDHKEEIDRIMEGLDSVKLKVQEKELLQRDLMKEKDQFLRNKTQYGLQVDQRIPEAREESTRKKLVVLHQKFAAAKEKMRELMERMTFLNFQREALSEQLDKIEQNLWDNQTFQEVKTEMSKRSGDITDGRSRSRGAGYRKTTGTAGFFAGIVLLMLGFFLSNGIGTAFLSIGLISLLISAGSVLFNKKKESVGKQEYSSTFSYEDYIKQTELRRQWREKLAEVDQVILELDQTKQMIQEQQALDQKLAKEFQEVKESNGYPSNVSLEELTEKEDPFEKLRQQSAELKEKKKYLDSLEKALQQWQEQLQFLQPVIREEWNDLPSFLQGLKQFFREVTEKSENRELLIQKARESDEKIGQWAKKQKELEHDKHALFRSAQSDNEQDFQKKYILYETLKKKKERLGFLKQQIAGDLELLQNIRDKAELSEKISGTQRSIQQRKKTAEQLLQKKINYEVAMKNLEEGGNYSVLLQEFANMESELQELVDRWASYKISADLIERTLTHARKDRFPETIVDAGSFFHLLTRGEYTKVLLHDDIIEVLRRDGSVFEATELSQGTAEQLYVALRFAFVKNSADLIQLPLLIDDGFVNFDATRRMEMFQLLKKMSETTQVLYFTFDSVITDVFRKEQVEML